MYSSSLPSDTRQATARGQVDNGLLEYSIYGTTMSTEMLKTRLKRQYTAGDIVTMVHT